MKNLLSERGTLRRPRLNALIKKGLDNPLLVMLAGPGYGKTQAMADYLAESKTKAVWLRLTELDNLSAHFWNHLLQSVSADSSDFFQSLNSLGFPETLSSFDIFLRIFEKYRDTADTIWVFDDFGAINEPRIKDFFRLLAGAELPNFRIVLLSNKSAGIESVAFLSGTPFFIFAKDLKFTPDEISGLYQLYDLSLTGDELTTIERQTEGWPLSLRLLVQQKDKAPDTLFNNETAISYLFEAQFFSLYSKPKQRLLLKLSLLEHFTPAIAMDLYDGAPAEIEGLLKHAFLTRETTSGRFFLHYLYRSFLQDKQYLLTTDETRQTWQKAAEACLLTGDYFEAVAYFCNSKDFASMLSAIDRYTNLEEFTETSALYFLKHINLLTPEELKDYPIADYIRARIYLGTLEFEKAERLLLDLDMRIQTDPSQISGELCIDTYMMLGNLHMLRSQEDFGVYFKKAAAYLPARTDISRTDRLYILNIHSFSLSDNQPGAADRMERSVHEAMPWFAKVFNGGGSGLEHLFSTEAAYLRRRLDDARQYAHRAIYDAESAAQHDIVCNAHLLLARIGFAQGNLEEMTKHLRHISDCAGRHPAKVLRDIRDTALAWYYVKLHDFQQIPKSVFEFIKTEQPLLAHGRTHIIYAHYLVNIGAYAEAIGSLEHPRSAYLANGIKMDSICRNIILAVCYHRLNNENAAMAALWTAYDMCYNNRLITLFLEAGEHMQSLIAAAKKQDLYRFDPEWLDLLDRETAAFNMQADSVRARYLKENPLKTGNGSGSHNPLSKRERDVLQALSRGLTREEIALKQFISVSTVKSTINSIYNKLGASNRAEAVSLALAHGYIEGYADETA